MDGSRRERLVLRPLTLDDLHDLALLYADPRSAASPARVNHRPTSNRRPAHSQPRPAQPVHNPLANTRITASPRIAVRNVNVGLPANWWQVIAVPPPVTGRDTLSATLCLVARPARRLSAPYDGPMTLATLRRQPTPRRCVSLHEHCETRGPAGTSPGNDGDCRAGLFSSPGRLAGLVTEDSRIRDPCSRAVPRRELAEFDGGAATPARNARCGRPPPIRSAAQNDVARERHLGALECASTSPAKPVEEMCLEIRTAPRSVRPSPCAPLSLKGLAPRVNAERDGRALLPMFHAPSLCQRRCVPCRLLSRHSLHRRVRRRHHLRCCRTPPAVALLHRSRGHGRQ